MIQYKVVIYKEGIWDSLLLGSSKVNPQRFTDFLNEYGRQGWKVQTMEKELRRLFLFWKRESYILVLSKD
ncbi:DUF4177 domain-containing protein [Candidatus Marinamargulisbacteria bacterium SCGC AG-343-D04]|nr:DUF4177 domain-containing protein [Candidatus Marinamargulisbacteria bacterium SCGC AG-343-D04]